MHLRGSRCDRDKKLITWMFINNASNMLSQFPENCQIICWICEGDILNFNGEVRVPLAKRSPCGRSLFLRIGRAKQNNLIELNRLGERKNRSKLFFRKQTDRERIVKTRKGEEDFHEDVIGVAC